MPNIYFFVHTNYFIFQFKTNFCVSVAEDTAVTVVFLVFVSAFETDADSGVLIFLLKMSRSCFLKRFRKSEDFSVPLLYDMTWMFCGASCM
jgi:hypothetical protein